ncbi:hypothetical protein FOL47_003609 [Perkinsus chesapeaki]|uniref:Uncharacterized protein n=1 Tax=Perkinsus chesapeaki TaxID=330153 RepID=A0A7J6KNP9_PERCH|nr:hypothetical protein FOL47_003609 [Perkinsus chesapeaki]
MFTSKTDNVSVVNWLTRKERRHWIRVTGICKHAVESRLQLIEDCCLRGQPPLPDRYTCCYSRQRVYHSLSLGSAVDQPLMAPLAKALRTLEAPSGEACAAGGAASLHPASDERQVHDWLATLPVRDGRVVVPPQDLPRVLRAVHDHEESKALFEEVRVWIDCPGLAAACRAIISACIDCQEGKAMPGDAQGSRLSRCVLSRVPPMSSTESISTSAAHLSAGRQVDTILFHIRGR